MDLLTQNTGYPNSIDTATAAADNTDTVVAQHTNGPNTAIVAIENELGVTPKGTAASVAARLNVNSSGDGGLLRGSSYPVSPPNVPHYFYHTVTNNLYIYNIATASYDAVTTAAVLASYIRSDLATTITAVHTFNPTVAGAPFILGANAQNQKVIGLDADTVDGKNPGSANGLATLNGSTKVVERLSYEAVASGVPTLDGASHVVQEPASKANANGLASLDASSKVVQEPASKANANGLASLDASSKVVQTALLADSATTATKLTDGTNLIHTKIINIGDWNMDTTPTITVAHGLTLSKIRGWNVIIRNDADTGYNELARSASNVSGALEGNLGGADATNISLQRLDGGFFDNTSYDSTSYNRGWITITYVD